VKYPLPLREFDFLQDYLVLCASQARIDAGSACPSHAQNVLAWKYSTSRALYEVAVLHYEKPEVGAIVYRKGDVWDVSVKIEGLVLGKIGL
jgi:hypothetical protein